MDIARRKCCKILGGRARPTVQHAASKQSSGRARHGKTLLQVEMAEQQKWLAKSEVVENLKICRLMSFTGDMYDSVVGCLKALNFKSIRQETGHQTALQRAAAAVQCQGKKHCEVPPESSHIDIRPLSSNICGYLWVHVHCCSSTLPFGSIWVDWSSLPGPTEDVPGRSPGRVSRVKSSSESLGLDGEELERVVKRCEERSWYSFKMPNAEECNLSIFEIVWVRQKVCQK